MSGVCAVVGRRDEPADHRLLDRMVGVVPYRASGGDERHGTDQVALAQLTRRGARHAGFAPAVDAATGVAVVADARIDNGRELRQALGSNAPPSAADPAQLVLAVYLRWGPTGLSRVLGDFAIVIWDPRTRRLLLARDPMAMRALYYRIEPRRLLVATEVAQLLAVPGVPAEPDERTIAAYLAGNFGSLEWSYYRGIAQVAPGQMTSIRDGVIQRSRYWDIDPEHRITYARLDDYAEHLKELFVEAVRARMLGGQRTGILLSGGVDSGAAAAAAGWLSEREQGLPLPHTYSWDFGELTECDERHVSRHIVDRYGLASKDVPVQDAGPLAGYPDHAPHLDDPFHGHFQTMLDRGFSRARDDSIGPLFTGMRGDLAIGPIDEDYRTLLQTRRLGQLAGEVRRHHRTTAEPVTAILRRDVLPVADRVARHSTMAAWARWALRRSPKRPDFRRSGPGDRLYPPWIRAELADRVGLSDIIPTYADTPAPALEGPFRRRRYQWLFMPMHLRWAVSHERRVASYGMEAVDAWSDRRIAEFCLAVPPAAIDAPFSLDKRLARRAMTGIAPAAFLREAGKTLPSPLFHRTLQSTAAPLIRDWLTDSRADAAGWIDASLLRDEYERFLGGGRLPGEMWWALSVEWWLRALEDQPADTRPPV